jgi:hypothetical protein
LRQVGSHSQNFVMPNPPYAIDRTDPVRVPQTAAPCLEYFTPNATLSDHREHSPRIGGWPRSPRPPPLSLMPSLSGMPSAQRRPQTAGKARSLEGEASGTAVVWSAERPLVADASYATVLRDGESPDARKEAAQLHSQTPCNSPSRSSPPLPTRSLTLTSHPPPPPSLATPSSHSGTLSKGPYRL